MKETWKIAHFLCTIRILIKTTRRCLKYLSIFRYIVKFECRYVCHVTALIDDILNHFINFSRHIYLNLAAVKRKSKSRRELISLHYNWILTTIFFVCFNLVCCSGEMASYDNGEFSFARGTGTAVAANGNGTARNGLAKIQTTQKKGGNGMCHDDSSAPVKAQTIDELHSLQKKKSAPTTPIKGTQQGAFAVALSEEERQKQQLQSIRYIIMPTRVASWRVEIIEYKIERKKNNLSPFFWVILILIINWKTMKGS